MSDPKYRSIKGVMANLAESLEKERDEVLTENSTLRAIIHGLHKQPCRCWVCERSADRGGEHE
jgi:hypothetical protein